MRISRIITYTVKHGKRYQPVGQSTPSRQLPTSDYFQFPPYPQLYSQRSEAMVVKVETDEGLTGWGEAQAPIGPEVTQTIVRTILGPMLLDQDPLETNLRYMEMYETLRVRGQVGGFQLDAIAALDTALWDIKARALHLPLSTLLGGRFRETLPCYVTGLRGKTLEARVEEALGWTGQGIGIKPCLGFGYAADRHELETLRDAVGDQARMFMDGLWKYSIVDAVRIARVLEAVGAEFFEAPLLPEDVDGHSRLAQTVDIAIAVGEPLRTRWAFLPWFQRQALDLCQPDLMRNGVTETVKIAELAESFNIPVALHTGCLTVIGMAASWHVSAAIPNFFIQEYQPVMMEIFNPWLREPLELRDGVLVVPTGEGLGIDIAEERFLQDVDNQVAIAA